MCPHDMIDGDGTQVIKGILFSPFRIFFTKWVLQILPPLTRISSPRFKKD
jgi:hypothetical protein